MEQPVNKPSLFSADLLASRAGSYSPGWIEAVKSNGVFKNDVWQVDTVTYNRICTQFFDPNATASPQGSKTGLGYVVSALATPIARAMKMPCIDPETKQLKPESGCAKRREALNNLGDKLVAALTGKNANIKP